MPCIVFLSTGEPSSRPNADDNFDSFAASKCHPRFCNCFFRAEEPSARAWAGRAYETGGKPTGAFIRVGAEFG
jgi:hypothetical protein